MDDVVITVRGHHEARRMPEEAVADIAIQVEGPDRGGVIERIAALAGPVRDDLAARRNAGSVTAWSSDRAAVWSERPWGPQGQRLAAVHHATVTVQAVFEDPAALSWWLDEVTAREGVQLSSIRWRLTPESAQRLEQEVAAAAVQVAVQRASAYARALGLAEVTASHIADAGLLGDADGSAPAPVAARAMMAAAPSGPAFDVTPQEVVAAATVEARFTAR